MCLLLDQGLTQRGDRRCTSDLLGSSDARSSSVRYGAYNLLSVDFTYLMSLPLNSRFDDTATGFLNIVAMILHQLYTIV